jgi:hypothetical protein
LFDLDRRKLRISADSLSKIAAEMEIDFKNYDFNINIPELPEWNDSISIHNFNKQVNDNINFYHDSVTSYFSYTTSDDPTKISNKKPKKARIVVTCASNVHTRPYGNIR